MVLSSLNPGDNSSAVNGMVFLSATWNTQLMQLLWQGVQVCCKDKLDRACGGCHLGDLAAECSERRFIRYFQSWVSSHQRLRREGVKRAEGTTGMEAGAARAAVGTILARPK